MLKKHQREWAELDVMAERVKAIVMDPDWRPRGWKAKEGEEDTGPSDLHRMRQAEQLSTILNQLGAYYGGKQVREREATATDLTKFGGVEPATAEANAQGARFLQRILDITRASKQGITLPPVPGDALIIDAEATLVGASQ